ncbi:ABC transporter ATP-binding protein [Nakamurella sp.]|uniref:ABC transporter ATP-binding protein n=1 Tax=Nakamurella sp. TaxID=1869182 RepID=UPI003B3ABDA2
MIEAIGLTKRYGSTVAVDDLSFTVRPGTVTGFLGPNGAGKSTTMRMILGLDNPNSGRALIGGKPYASLQRPLTQVGALLDANWVHPNRSARAHLRFMAASNKLPRRRVDEVLDLVGLSNVAGKAVGKFSLGMKQRLGLAGALLGDPQVLLFDEPVNGLDPEGIYWIRTFMKNLAAQGRTVFVSSHLLSEMALTADHLIVIGRGRLIADAATPDFIARATRASVRVRSPRLADLRAALVEANLQVVDAPPGPVAALEVLDAPIEQVGDVAGAAGITLHELTPQLGSLEEAFIQLTGDAVEYGGSRARPAGAPPAPALGGPVPAGQVPGGQVPGGPMPGGPGAGPPPVAGAGPGVTAAMPPPGAAPAGWPPPGPVPPASEGPR